MIPVIALDKIKAIIDTVSEFGTKRLVLFRGRNRFSYIRFGVRILLLIIVLFIFIWWPVSTYTPEGFDEWSKRMSELPENVWYILMIIMVTWGATEAIGGNSKGDFSPPSFPDSSVRPPFPGVEHDFPGSFDTEFTDEEDYFDDFNQWRGHVK